eukprot:2248337-Prymnesium_polylepis.1
MLKDHMGSSGDHFGSSSVTSTSPPLAARRPTGPRSSRKHDEISPNPPLPQRASQSDHRVGCKVRCIAQRRSAKLVSSAYLRSVSSL